MSMNPAGSKLSLPFKVISFVHLLPKGQTALHFSDGSYVCSGRTSPMMGFLTTRLPWQWQCVVDIRKKIALRQWSEYCTDYGSRRVKYWFRFRDMPSDKIICHVQHHDNKLPPQLRRPNCSVNPWGMDTLSRILVFLRREITFMVSW